MLDVLTARNVALCDVLCVFALAVRALDPAIMLLGHFL